MSDIQEAYSKGYEDGQKAVLRLVKHIVDDAPKSGYSTSYYKISLKMLLEVYDYGKEKKKQSQQKTSASADGES